MRFAFGRFELDPATFELRRDGAAVPTQRKVFDFLLYLVEHRDRAVTKQELLERLWPGEHVSESALTWCASQARKALGQRRSDKAPIETLHGRGYRFRADVEATPAAVAAAGPVEAAGAAARAVPSDPFVGRDAVLARLRGSLDAAVAGRGGFALLAGDAGIGKTRCAEELARSGQATHGLRAWWSRCSQAEGTSALWPWVQLLREMIADPGAGSAAPGAQELLDEVAPRRAFGDAGEEPAWPGDGGFWAIDAVSRLVLDAARATPRLIVVDDLQWADELSLRALELMASAAPRHRLLLVATLRDVDLDADTRRSGLMRRLLRHATRTDLGGFDAERIAAYVERVTGARPAEALVRALLERTAGNPLFLQETLRLLVDRLGPEQAARATGEDIELPPLVRDVIRSRVERCEPAVRHVLGVASAMDDEVDLTVLGAVADLDEEALLEALDRAVEGRLLVELPGVGRYAFAHAAVRDTLYGDLSSAVRARHHRRIGEALRRRDGADEDAARIAHHLHRALPTGDPHLIVDYAVRAAAAARRLHAYSGAARFYGWALEALDLMGGGDVRQRCDLLIGLAMATRGAGAEKEARRHAERVIALAREHGQPDLLVRAARCLRPTFAWRRAPDTLAREALETALDALPRKDARSRVTALRLLAGIPPYSMSVEKSRALSDRAIELARPLGERQLAEALHSGIFSRTGPDDIDALLDLTAQMLKLDGERTWTSAEARYARFVALLQRGDLAAAERELEEFGRLARARRLPEALWNYDRNRAQLAYQRGRVEAAQRGWQALAERAEQIGLWYGTFLLPTHQAGLEWDLHGRSPLESAPGIWDRLWDSARLSARWRSHVVRLLAEGGRREEARERFEELLGGGLAALPRDQEYLATVATLGMAAVALCDRRRAADIEQALRPYPAHNSPDAYAFTMGSVSTYLGLLAVFLDRPEQARADFELAIERNLAMDQRLHLPHTRLEYARLLVDRFGDAAALDRARSLLAEARSEAAAMGMTRFDGELAALEARIGSRAP